MRVRATLIAGAVTCFSAGFAYADNSACWGDDSRQDISCTQITEKLLLSFRGKTTDFVSKAMKAPGRGIKGGLHFISNYGHGEKSGTGDVNVSFEDGRAAYVNASVDSSTGKSQDFIWSAYTAPALGGEIEQSTKDFGRQPFCSDLSGMPNKCSTKNGMSAQLTKMQMQGNTSKDDLLKLLNAACDPGGGLLVTDAAGDCPRLRNLLRP